tara:strand:+ start:160 stop:519 length:360 start_codon:yes stop_codon:yes gene_type:complete
MNKNILEKINKLIDVDKINEAQFELSKLGPEYLENSDYLFLRSKIFFINKTYYLAIDTLLIATEFGESDKIYNLLAKIYKVLKNEQLSNKFLDSNLRLKTVNFLKDELSGIYRKNKVQS